MFKDFDFLNWFSAFATWAVVCGISLLILRESVVFSEALILQLMILLTMLVAIHSNVLSEKQGLKLTMFVSMLALVFLLSWRVHIEFFFIYSIIWIAVAPNFFTQRSCWLWLLVINLGWYAIRVSAWQQDHPLAETLLVATFHLFALLSATVAIRAEQANAKTQQLNRELIATQHLLSEASRESERTRIARDLHDLLGHHLTALTINLQVAGRLSEGEAHEKVEQCHALAKLLLSDVREAVSTLRDTPVVNVHELLSLAIRDIPGLEIELTVPSDLQLEDVNTAEVLLRTVQESITNSLRHAKASKASVTVAVQDQQIKLCYSDNGAGTADLQPGNGLRGMRERIERARGSLTLTGLPHMQINVTLPLVEA